LVCLILIVLVSTARARAAELDDLLGKWELSEAALGMPAGAVWDFRKGGELQVAVKDKSLGLKYELKGKYLVLEVKGQKDVTQIISLSRTDLVLKDNDGGTLKLKKAK
jgi:hypothetical protein